MNILLINHEMGGGGASFSLCELATELIKKGHHIYVLTPFNEGPFWERINGIGATVLYEPYHHWVTGHYPLKMAIQEKRKWILKKKRENRKTARKIAKFATENKIDVIHTNTGVINIGALISKYSGIPHVWHLREFGDLDIGVRYFERRNKVYRFMNRYTDRFLCVSRAIADHYDRLNAAKKTVIYNGVSPRHLTDNSRAPQDVVNIIIAGQIAEHKGQREAAQACSLLVDRGINNFVLHMAGRGNLYFDVPTNLQDKIKIWGEVDHPEELRKAMDIELVCSRCEAFGRVVAEAMLGGLVVIGTNSGGIPELIHHGEDGFLYQQGDVTELCDTLEYLIKNPDVRDRVGTAARDYAKGRFFISRCADEVEKVYMEVTNA